VPISAKTKKKVLEAAKRLDYVPSAAARILRIGSSRTLGILGTSADFFRRVGKHESNGMASESMHGILNTAVKRGYHITLLTGSENSDLSLNAGLADGLLVLNRDLSTNTAVTDMLRSYVKPVVYALDYPDHAAYTAPDDAGGAILAVSKLLEAGHKHIGFVRIDNFTALFDRRQSGWEKALYSAGITPRKDWVIEFSEERMPEYFPAALTAVICANYSIFLRFKEFAAHHGKRIPEDVSIIVFSYRPVHNEALESISRVTIPLSEIVSEGVEMLIDWIEGNPQENMEKKFPYEYAPGSTIQSI
jgi:DNA-binding LacI/PurR family transcriptional regulator